MYASFTGNTVMVRYYCPKCNVDFLKEKPDINQRHHCGEFAHLDWGTGKEGDADQEAA